MMLSKYSTCSTPHAGNPGQTGSQAIAHPFRASRRAAVTVHNVISLTGIWRKSAATGRPAQAAVSCDAEHGYVAVTTASRVYKLLDPQAVETPPAPTSTIHPRKAVQGVPVVDRPAVELVMALANLTAHSSGPLVSGWAGPASTQTHTCSGSSNLLCNVQMSPFMQHSLLVMS